MVTAQISAIICTHNRAEYLGAAIDSLLSQTFANEFEVIVVDNASTDRTADLLATYQSQPRFRSVVEPVLGLSVARNRGAQIAAAPILAYLDDDAIASPTWLAELDRAFASDATLAIVGGRVRLQWALGVAPPRWLSPNLAGSLGAYDLGDRPVYIHQAGLTPRGVNYAIRRPFLDQVGGFDVKLGRVGANLLSNEELHMTELALATGWRVAYWPTAAVTHHVATERLQPSWFIRRGWWQGISECYREQLTGRAGIAQLKRGGERLLRGTYQCIKYVNDPALRFDNFVYAYGQLGYLKAVVSGLLTPTIARGLDT